MEAAGGLVCVIISGVIFSVEMVLSAELDTEGLGSMLVTFKVFLGFPGDGLGPELCRDLFSSRCDPGFDLRGCGVDMGSLGPLGESVLGVGDHCA